MRKLLTAVGIMCVGAPLVLADFTYQDTSTITGGMIASVMKVAGVFSKSAREPIRNTVSVKGDRMVQRAADSGTIIDLGAQTITHIDFKKKAYSVMTFDEMKQALEQMSQKMKEQQKKDGAEVKFKVSANATGNTKQIAGLDAKEMVMKMEMETTDEKSGQKGSMVITSDMWLAPGVKGYDEVRDFYRRMAEKIKWTPSGNMFMAANPEVSQGMAEVSKEAAKVDGVPVLSVVTMGGAVPPGAEGSQPGAQEQPQQQPAERPSVGGALGGALGGKLGLGGFGRKKSPPKEEQQTGSQPAKAGPPPGTLLEMKTELSDFSSAAVDPGQFEIPAGFKKVESDLKKAR